MCHLTFQIVIAAIKNTETLPSINLGGHAVSVQAAQKIGDALKENRKLKTAIFRDICKGQTKTDASSILELLNAGLKAAHTQLEMYDISNNTLGSVGITALNGFFRSDVFYSLQVVIYVH